MKYTVTVLLSSLLFLAGLSSSAMRAEVPASQADTLNQYVSDLQKSPDDDALREKIIKLAQEMRPAPAIPAEVDEQIGQAKYVFKHAKSQEDFIGAVEAYKKALLIAPWVGDYYYNLGVAQEQAGQPRDAIKSFNFYLLTSPGDKDAREARERIGGLKYAAEKAAKELSPEAVAAREKNREQDLVKRLDGAKYVGRSTWTKDMIHDNELVIRGTTLVWRKRVAWAAPDVIREDNGQWMDAAPPMHIVGRRAEAHTISAMPDYVGSIFTISADGNSITEVQQTVNGGTFTYYRQ